MKLLLAARLSQRADGQTGITPQDQDARRWAQEHGHEIIATAADKISGHISPFKRRNLGPWLTRPELIAQYDGICASKMDRYTRVRDWDMRQWAERNGKVLIITQFDLTWPPAPGDFVTPQMWDMLVTQSVGESESIRQRYERMHTHLAESGYVAGGGILFGYRLAREDGGYHKILEPDPELYRDGRHVIEHMADKYLDGWSLADIGSWLDSEKVAPPGGAAAWHAQTISAILRNPAICGRKKNYGRTLKVKPVLSSAKQRQVIARMDAAGHRRGTPTADTALLTSILRCMNCGRAMYRNHKTDSGRRLKFYYHCRPKKGVSCRNMVPLEITDAMVDDWYSGIYPPDKPYVEYVTTPGDDYAEELHQNAEDIRALDDDWLAGKIDEDTYDRNRDKLRAERKHIRWLQEHEPKPPQVIEHRTGETFFEHWKAMDTAAKRAWLMRPEREVKMAAGELNGRKVLRIQSKVLWLNRLEVLPYPERPL